MQDLTQKKAYKGLDSQRLHPIRLLPAAKGLDKGVILWSVLKCEARKSSGKPIYEGKMKAGNTPFRNPAEARPVDVLQQFMSIFATSGWLNQNLRIKHRDRRCRIFCSESQFIAYRINDNCGISKGIPGWPVYMGNHDHVIEDSEMSAFESTEPRIHDWLRRISDGYFEIILRGL